MPPVTQTLLIANVAVFFLANMAGGGWLFNWFALWPPTSGPSAGPDFQVWQLVTYSFLHGGFAHIFFNMFGLYMFGSDIERLFGARFYAGYYFASVLAAAVVHLVVSAWLGAPPYPTVGASGGLYGLMLLIPPIPMRARTFVIVFAVISLAMGVTGTADGIAHFAHLGGMLGGWLMIQYRRGGFGRR
jgi:membrane associated rhomboid family serine protease